MANPFTYSELHSMDVKRARAFYSELFTGEPEVKDGYVALSDRPGLGIDLDEEVVARYRV